MPTGKGTYIHVSLIDQKGQFYGSKMSIQHNLKIKIHHDKNEAEDQETLRGLGNREIPPPPIQVEKLYPQEGKSWQKM